MSMMRAALLAACGLAIAVGCPAPPTEAAPDAGRFSRVDRLLAQLHADDPDAREAAASRLARLPSEALDLRTRLKLLTEAARDLPPTADHRSSALTLVRLAAYYVDEAYLPLLDALVDRYPTETVGPLLHLVGQMPSERAAHTYLRYLARFASLPAAAREDLPFGTLADEPRHQEILIPGLSPHLFDPELGWDARRLVLQLCRGWPGAATLLAPAAPALLAAHAQHFRAVKPFQGKAAPEFWNNDASYNADRAALALSLDLLQCLPPRLVDRPLERALRLRDPRLRYFAAVSRLHAGLGVSDRALAALAEEREVRSWLLRDLAEMGRLDALPPRLRGQAAVAEADLGWWLIYKRGIPDPPPLELMERVELEETEDGTPEVYYVFRFQDPTEGGSERVAGVAGPYTADPEDLSGGSRSGSLFIPADALTPDGHVRRFLRDDED